MMPSAPKSQANTRRWMFWDICLYLFLELGLFVTVKYVFHVTEERLLGPYVALAVPGVIFLVLVRGLWKWEERGPSPARLAFGWGLSVALLFLAICVAFFYSSVELQLVDPNDAVWVFGMMGVAVTALGFFIPYNMTLQRISSKVARNTNGSRPD